MNICNIVLPLLQASSNPNLVLCFPFLCSNSSCMLYWIVCSFLNSANTISGRNSWH
jgi:hypothetical protein